MTTPLRSILSALGWSVAHAARMAGVSFATLRPWVEGHNARGNPATAPEWALHYFGACLHAVQRVPKPSSIPPPRGAVIHKSP